MRSGIKCKASELVRDGRIPSLLVLPAYADPPQPQEQPYVPNDLEGAPRFPVSPDNPQPNIPPVLSGEVDDEELANLLTWTAGGFAAGPTIEEYDVYRDDGDGFVLVDTVVLEFDGIGRVTGPALAYTDTDVVNGETYSYRVTALTGGGRGLTSNVVTLQAVAPAPPNPVYLEDHVMTADGDGGSGAQAPIISIIIGAGNDIPLGTLWIGGGANIGGVIPVIIDGTPATIPDPEGLRQSGRVYTADQWWRGDDPPTPSDYQVRCSVVSGLGPNAGNAIDTWLSLAFDRTWTAADVFGGIPVVGVWRIEIRSSSTLEVLASGDMSITQTI